MGLGLGEGGIGQWMEAESGVIGRKVPMGEQDIGEWWWRGKGGRELTLSACPRRP